ncbi:winged helix DNA-binding protein [Brevibacterium casei]|nr:winged helix DNA-binding protein [Brevibacterium casei]
MRRLEARRLVIQSPDPEDQRGVLVELTEAGRKRARNRRRRTRRSSLPASPVSPPPRPTSCSPS